jgi:hypothetical protein
MVCRGVSLVNTSVTLFTIENIQTSAKFNSVVCSGGGNVVRVGDLY